MLTYGTAPTRALSHSTDLGATQGLRVSSKRDSAKRHQMPIGNQATLRSLRISMRHDPLEAEAGRVANAVLRSPAENMDVHAHGVSDVAVQRACACGGTDESACSCDGDNEQTILRSATDAPMEPIVASVHDVVRSPGQMMDAVTRRDMESRFNFDFSGVRVHTDARAGESAQSVNARAYTLGRDVVFGSGQYSPTSAVGRELLAHELTHVVQQAGQTGDLLSRAVVDAEPAPESPEQQQAPRAPQQPASSTAGTPAPEVCVPPADMPCFAAPNSPAHVTNTLLFAHDSAALTVLQRAEIDAAVVAWRAAGAGAIVRVDGYASAEGPCAYNWQLSCRRAEAVTAELVSPADGSPGVPRYQVIVLAHGESNEFSVALDPNRRATISFPGPPPSPPQPTPVVPACALPVQIGSAGRCGAGADFDHFDFPPKTLSLASKLKLGAWAATHGKLHWSGVSNLECETEMMGVLFLALGAGVAAFRRFQAGTGGTEVLGPSSSLGSDALVAPSFLAVVGAVQTAIESQLAGQAASGTLDPCLLSVRPGRPSFGPSDSVALKTVIGGTQGATVYVTRFSGSATARSYSMDLRFVICDNFGVDEHDLYFFGLFPFWVLQHERDPLHYIPFINELDLPVTVSGTF